MLKLKSNTLATWCKELTHWKIPWGWERLRAGGEGDNRGWDGWMASLIWWTCVWTSSGSWWWAGRPGVLRSMGSQRVGHNWVAELNWTDSIQLGFPGGSDGKESACHVGDPGSISGVRMIPWRGGWHPTRVFFSCLENSMDRGAWRDTVHGSQGVKWPSDFTLASHFLDKYYFLVSTFIKYSWLFMLDLELLGAKNYY